MAAPISIATVRNHQVSHHFGSIWNSATATLAENGPSRTRDRISGGAGPEKARAKEMTRSLVSV